MENFVALLKQTGDVDARFGFRDFHRIECGKFSVSVQASRTHYCTPRATLPRPDSYSAFEIAIFDKDDGWVVPPRDARLKDMSWADLFEDPGEESSTSVAGYVPRETVQQILNDLEAL